MHKHYFRCSSPQPRELTNIEALQKKMFMEMEESVGEIRGETDIPGLRLDFNVGLRLDIPSGDYHISISDAISHTIFLMRTSILYVLYLWKNTLFLGR